MRFSLTISIFIFLLSSNTSAFQTTISGVITDKSSKEPLIGVSVYLAGTTNGSSTIADGSYSFSTKLEGSMVLVASIIGSKSMSKEIFVVNGESQSHNFELEENTYLLNEVYVTGSSEEEWKRRYQAFERFFIGEDDNANRTKIHNPEMIDFESMGGSNYKVSFREPIRITNRALGYEIELELERAEFNLVNNTGFWLVYPRYSEIESSNRRERQIWRSNRTRSYRGSSVHFFKSLYENRVKSNQFYLHPHSRSIQVVNNRNRIQNAFPGNWRKIIQDYVVFEILDPQFGVAYNPDLNRSGEINDLNLLNTFKIKNFAGFIVTDKYGNIYNSQEVIFLGTWANDRFSKSLPLDYN